MFQWRVYKCTGSSAKKKPGSLEISLTARIFIILSGWREQWNKRTDFRNLGHHQLTACKRSNCLRNAIMSIHFGKLKIFLIYALLRNISFTSRSNNWEEDSVLLSVITPCFYSSVITPYYSLHSLKAIWTFTMSWWWPKFQIKWLHDNQCDNFLLS